MFISGSTYPSVLWIETNASLAGGQVCIRMGNMRPESAKIPDKPERQNYEPINLTPIQ